MCKEIVQYYYCYCWCGVISRLFHYLTHTHKKKKKKKTDLQIAILEKIHMFYVFLREIEDKKLRKSNQIKKSFSIIVVTIGPA